MPGYKSGSGPIGRKKARRSGMLEQAQQYKAAGMKHTGLGQAAKALEASQASGAKHTGAGQQLKKKLRKASNVTWY